MNFSINQENVLQKIKKKTLPIILIKMQILMLSTLESTTMKVEIEQQIQFFLLHSTEFNSNFKFYLFFDPEILLLRIYSTEIPNMCIEIYILEHTFVHYF